MVRDEFDLLREHGHEVKQLMFANPDDPIRSAMSIGAAPWNPRSRNTVRSNVDEFKPDVIHVHNTWFAGSPAVIAAGQTVPLVMTLHNYRLICANALLFRSGRPCIDCVGNGPWRGVAHRCYRGQIGSSFVSASTISLNRALGTWAHVDRFVTVTDFSRSIHVEGGLPKEKMAIRPNFAPDPGDRPAPPSSSDYVLIAGRLSREKGLDVAIRAWNHAQTDRLNLIIAGDGPERTYLENLADDSVRFLGLTDHTELIRLMMEARALLLPSRCFEGQPRVALEAMACGLPVVASDLGGLPETLGGGVAGTLVPAGDVPRWTDAISQLSSDHAAVDRLGASARDLYRSKHTPETALAGINKIYAEAIASSG